MAFEDYDVEYGYSLSDLRRSYSKKAYVLADYDKRSLEEVKRCIEAGSYRERSECMDHLSYLDGIQKKLSLIAMAEEREGIMNWELKEVLGTVRKLAARLSELSTQLPTVVVYTTSDAQAQPGKAEAGIGEKPVGMVVESIPEPLFD